MQMSYSCGIRLAFQKFCKLAKQAEAIRNSAKKRLGISEINSIPEWRVFLLNKRKSLRVQQARADIIHSNRKIKEVFDPEKLNVETVPCVTNAGSILDSCQSLCEEVRLNCGEDFKLHNISFPQCIPNYPEVDVGNGLCSLTHWPVSWPLPAKMKQNPGLFDHTDHSSSKLFF